MKILFNFQHWEVFLSVYRWHGHPPWHGWLVAGMADSLQAMHIDLTDRRQRELKHENQSKTMLKTGAQTAQWMKPVSNQRQLLVSHLVHDNVALKFALTATLTCTGCKRHSCSVKRCTATEWGYSHTCTTLVRHMKKNSCSLLCILHFWFALTSTWINFEINFTSSGNGHLPAVLHARP